MVASGTKLETDSGSTPRMNITWVIKVFLSKALVTEGQWGEGCIHGGPLKNILLWALFLGWLPLAYGNSRLKHSTFQARGSLSK